MSEPPRDVGGHWFEPVAEHLGSAYLRYSFTRGTAAEVDAVIALAGLAPGAEVLDVGCGPGRHALELARRGHRVHGVDISGHFVDLARRAAHDEGLEHATFEVADARDLAFDGRFDLALSLCQGGFGLTGGPAGTAGPAVDRAVAELDEPVLAGMARAVVDDGVVIVSAFSAYFQLRFEEAHDRFDPVDGVNEEETTVRNPHGVELATRLWTTCYTPRELRLLARAVGLRPEAVHGVTPGRYGPAPPTTDLPEFLLVARRPSSWGIVPMAPVR